MKVLSGILPIFFALLCLAGCGVETASTAATVATLKAKEIQHAQESKDQIIQQLDAVQKQSDQRSRDAEEK